MYMHNERERVYYTMQGFILLLQVLQGAQKNLSSNS